MDKIIGGIIVLAIILLAGWVIVFVIFVVPTYIILSLYAALKFFCTNFFIVLDKLFYPGFDAPAIVTWGFWGLIGGIGIQGCREMQIYGRKGIGVLIALMPLLLLGLISTVKGINVSENVVEPAREQQKTTRPIQNPEETSKATPTTTKQTTPNPDKKSPTPRNPVQTTKKRISTSPLPIKSTKPRNVPTKQNTVTTPAVDPKPSIPSAPVNMVLIPAGEFQMGSNESDDEKPVHTVYIDAFYMDKYEVTNAQYKVFLQANPQWQKGRISSKYHDGDYLKHWSGNNYPNGKANHPVNFVSWYAAMAYAKWTGKRLPTEAEWEKAARGKLVSKKYPWGDSINTTKANYNKNVDDTTSVGKYQPNGYGLSDMAGNVLEWCIDEYDENFYSSSMSQNPVAGGNIVGISANYLNITATRVLRGGSWTALAQNVRVSDRTKGNPTLSYFGIGFRCVQAVIPTVTITATTDTEKKTTANRTPVRTTNTQISVPKAHIQKVWVNHNQYQDSVKGMRIHVKFDIDNFKDNKGLVVAYFYMQNGSPLKDTNGRYNTTSGEVSTLREFKPRYFRSIYNDFKLFMPYQELHMMGGKHNLKFFIKIFKSDTWDVLSEASDLVHFTYSR